MPENTPTETPRSGWFLMPMQALVAPLLAMPRVAKRALALLLDSSFCVLTIWLAYCFRLNEWTVLTGVQWLPVFVSLCMALPIFIVMGMYRAIFRYANMAAFITVLKAIAIYGVAFMTIFTALSVPGVPRTVGILQPFLLLIAIGLSRLSIRYWLGDAYQRILHKNMLAKVLIYGAGTAGRQLAGALINSAELNVVGYLDDDPRLKGGVMGGLPIYDPSDLPVLAESLGVHNVLLALPSASRQRRNEILEHIRKARVNVRTLPDLTALAQGRIAVSDIRELEIEDLLGREAVAPRQELLDKSMRNKVVMVTGAGGSIGGELCRQILRTGPSSLILIDQNEFALYNIHAELQKLAELYKHENMQIVPILCSVRDQDRMEHVMQSWRPQTLYHAAAYKHVPLVEHNAVEGIKNNVMGTLVAARAANKCGVSNFVLISTDKAVRPTNVMGASKRLAEMVLQALAAEAAIDRMRTNFSMVRFGNVLGSSGSVVPLFRQQIKEGGPVTLTHPDITRYFMTISEASQLVIQAGAMAEGGDVFLLDMGEPVRIADLARKMVELSGLAVRDEDNPEGDIELSVTGLRPGEKLFEELLIGDNPETTEHPRIMKAREDFLSWPELSRRLNTLNAALDRNDMIAARATLAELVSGYSSTGEVSDLAFTGAEPIRQPETSISRHSLPSTSIQASCCQNTTSNKAIDCTVITA
ncbi:polysaccharide biosynthesis protein [Rhizobium laguerreae]|nr:nucleoside-diphosphate sugar epimerase/dehydratase [Rhizobium laguerreae]